MRLDFRSGRWSVNARAAALAVGLALTGGAASAQQGTPAGGAVPVAMPPVDLHAGTCANPTLEPEAEIGDLMRQQYGDIESDLGEALGEDLDGDGVLDEGEDLNGNGVLDTDIGIGTDDLDGDGVRNEDEENYLTEDLDGDEVIDAGEDINGNGVLDAGVDADNNAALEDDEIVPAGGAALVVSDPPTVWRAEGEIDADFDELFGEQQVIAVHQSAEQYETIIACGDVAAVDWEDQDEVTIGLRQVDDSGYYGYAVLERDTGNVPVFGENTTGVTVYLFEDLPTQRQERMAQATPTP
jgi:hypothetical protein